MRTKRVILTGATGFIGSHLVERLLAEGFVVDAVTRASSDEEAAARLPRFRGRSGWRALAGDVREAMFGRTAADFRGADAIVHLAALPKLSATACLEEMRAAHAGGARRVLDVARFAGVPRVLHFSTAFVPAEGGEPLPETPSVARDAGANPYERSKAEAEAVVAKARGVGAEILRPGIVLPPADADAASIAASPLGAFLGALRVDGRGRARIPAEPSLRAGFCSMEDVVDFVLARLRAKAPADRDVPAWNLVPEEASRPSFEELARAGAKVGLLAEATIDPAASNRRLETWAPYTLKPRAWRLERTTAFLRAAGLRAPRVEPERLERLLRTWAERPGAPAWRRIATLPDETRECA
jgi:nucleoside-diphosphate-sugar epimerase